MVVLKNGFMQRLGGSAIAVRHFIHGNLGLAEDQALSTIQTGTVMQSVFPTVFGNSSLFADRHGQSPCDAIEMESPEQSPTRLFVDAVQVDHKQVKALSMCVNERRDVIRKVRKSIP
jgi:hypothetical protein